MEGFLLPMPEELGPRLLIAGLLITIVILLYLLYRSKHPAKRREKQKRNYLPRYSQFIPSRQGECYDILSSWSTDKTSHEMIIHNLNPNANEAKMIINKTPKGWLMRMYNWSGNLLYENNKITTHELANKFFEIRQPPPIYQPPTNEKPVKTYTIEIK